MQITRRSHLTGKDHTMELDVTPEQLARFQGGELVQRVFPHLNADQREFLMTGTTAEEWNAAFPEDAE